MIDWHLVLNRLTHHRWMIIVMPVFSLVITLIGLGAPFNTLLALYSLLGPVVYFSYCWFNEIQQPNHRSCIQILPYPSSATTRAYLFLVLTVGLGCGLFGAIVGHLFGLFFGNPQLNLVVILTICLLLAGLLAMQWILLPNNITKNQQWISLQLSLPIMLVLLQKSLPTPYSRMMIYSLSAISATMILFAWVWADRALHIRFGLSKPGSKITNASQMTEQTHFFRLGMLAATVVLTLFGAMSAWDYFALNPEPNTASHSSRQLIHFVTASTLFVLIPMGIGLIVQLATTFRVRRLLPESQLSLRRRLILQIGSFPLGWCALFVPTMLLFRAYDESLKILILAWTAWTVLIFTVAAVWCRGLFRFISSACIAGVWLIVSGIVQASSNAGNPFLGYAAVSTLLALIFPAAVFILGHVIRTMPPPRSTEAIA